MAHGRCTSAILANGAYPVVASVSDGAGNPGSATQQLTVDTVLPVVTIDDGASVHDERSDADDLRHERRRRPARSSA